jgi:PilZ domain
MSESSKTESFVSNLLREAFEEDARIVAVNIPGEKFKTRSKITRVHFAEVSMGKLDPPYSGEPIPKNTELEFSLFFHGGRFTFSTRFLRFKNDEFFVEMPRTVDMEDRRPYCRVPPSNMLPVDIIEIEGYPTRSQVNVLDISELGIGLEFPDKPKNLCDQEIMKLTIRIGALMDAELKGRICYATQSPTGSFNIGLELQGMTDNQKSALSACVHAGQGGSFTITSHS